MEKFIIVSHKYLPQPDDDLVLYLNRHKKNKVMHIMHSYPDAKDRRSFSVFYMNGKKKINNKSLDYRFLPEVFIYIKECLFTIKWAVFSKTKWDLYVGMDGLTVLFGLIIKSLGFCNEVVFWCIDFVPYNRFSQNWKNNIYHFINILATRGADEVWDLSPRMKEGRKKYLGLKSKDYKSSRVVPYGLWLNRIKKPAHKKIQIHTLVFMGHLLKKQGVDTVINKIPDVVKKIPDFKFKIIGSGSYEKELKKLAKTLNVEKYCNFVGRINDNVKMENEILTSGVAIAPYLRTKYSYTYYADPGKVKTYLACGVPVLLTNLPWNAKEIEKIKCGKIISSDGVDLVKKLTFLMDTNTNKEYRKNTAKYSSDFDYDKIFNKLDL